MKLDDKDHPILKALQRDARWNLAAIGRRIGLSQPAGAVEPGAQGGHGAGRAAGGDPTRYSFNRATYPVISR